MDSWRMPKMNQQKTIQPYMNSQPAVHGRKTPPVIKDSTETSPFDVEFFMVQCLCFRGMAYCDDEGNWRNAYSNSQLMGHIYLLE